EQDRFPSLTLQVRTDSSTLFRFSGLDDWVIIRIMIVGELFDRYVPCGEAADVRVAATAGCALVPGWLVARLRPVPLDFRQHGGSEEARNPQRNHSEGASYLPRTYNEGASNGCDRSGQSGTMEDNQ